MNDKSGVHGFPSTRVKAKCSNQTEPALLKFLDTQNHSSGELGSSKEVHLVRRAKAVRAVKVHTERGASSPLLLNLQSVLVPHFHETSGC
jgi:hypothetical protein